MERKRRELAQQRAQQQELQQRQADAGSRRQAAAIDAANLVQAAIDNNTKLKTWQITDPAKWTRAIEIDKIMRQLPENQFISLEERFTKVVRFVEAEASLVK